MTTEPSEVQAIQDADWLLAKLKSPEIQGFCAMFGEGAVEALFRVAHSEGMSSMMQHLEAKGLVRGE